MAVLGACVGDFSHQGRPFASCSSNRLVEECLGKPWVDIILTNPFYSCWVNSVNVGAITDETPNNKWFPDVTCGDLPRDVAFPAVPACCHRVLSELGLPTPTGSIRCIHKESAGCMRGWSIGVSSFDSGLVGCGNLFAARFRVNLQQQIIQPGSGVETPGVTKGTGTACRCNTLEPPYVSEEWQARGIQTCILRLNIGDGNDQGCESFAACCRGGQCDMMHQSICIAFEGEWLRGVSCEPVNPCVDDDFQCQILGMPVYVDDEGKAGFVSEPKRISEERDECDRMHANPYLEDDGMVGVAACFDFQDGVPMKVGLGGVAQPDCAAAYVDVEWDVGFECE